MRIKVKTIWRMTRAILWTCLGFSTFPIRAQDTQPDPFVALQLTPEFMIVQLRYELGPSFLWDRLVPVDHYSVQAIPNERPDVWTDDNIKELLTSVDAILTRWVAPLSAARAEQVAIIQQSYARLPARLRDSNPKGGLAYDREFIEWSKEHCDFIKDAADVVTFTQLLQHLRPGSIESDHLAGGYDAQFALKNRLPFGKEMADISAVIDLPNAKKWLPARFDLERLRVRERALKQQDERHAFDYQSRVSNVEAAVVAQDVRQAWGRGPLAAGGARVATEIDLLKERMTLLADPFKSGFCERTKIDLRSLAASGGNPRRVRMVDGRSADIQTWDYYTIFSAYSRGCGGRQDMQAAKRTLQLWADAFPENPKMVLASHCTLAIWERYGVGGRREESAAQEWRARALRVTGQACPAERPEELIDPRNPILDLHL